MSIQLFLFRFLFSSYFCSVDAFDVCIASGHWNQSSSALLLRSFWVIIITISSSNSRSILRLPTFSQDFFWWSLEYAWQQVSSGLQDSLQYCGRSQQCCSLNGLDLNSSSLPSKPLVIFSSAPFTPITSLLFIRAFHISVSWWSFTGNWVTVCLLKSPGLFSVFWSF